MIETTQGNLLEADAEALVNTVNCVGVMGKGIALQFKQAFPANFASYKKACDAGLVQPGKMLVIDTGAMLNPRYIVNFPTKRHWKGKSRLEDIDSGLLDLVAQVRRLGIGSIAIPPLGAGLGGLAWTDIRPRIEAAFADLPDVRVLLFEPKGAPAVDAMPVNTARPRMTVGRALLLRLLDLYAQHGYRHSLLEVQKLAYFLQEAGEPLRLEFKAHHFGPYAEKLNHALQRIEGHFIRGYGDRASQAEIRLLPEALADADALLAKHPEANAHLSSVKALIEGFETPYGMELLATVHWVATRDEASRRDPERLCRKVGDWSPRKRQVLKPTHIHKAFSRLTEQAWLSAKV